MQDKIRERLKTVHKDIGTPYSFIAKQVGISGGYLSLFIKGDREVSQETAQKIDELLKEIIERAKKL